jgi:hypothetical protein
VSDDTNVCAYLHLPVSKRFIYVSLLALIVLTAILRDGAAWWIAAFQCAVFAWQFCVIEAHLSMQQQ